jgi:DNA-binding CsgD family transcriptional regulator
MGDMQEWNIVHRNITVMPAGAGNSNNIERLAMPQLPINKHAGREAWSPTPRPPFDPRGPVQAPDAACVASLPLIDALERMGCGGMLLDEGGYALLTNPTALRLLWDEVGPPSGHVEEREWVCSAIKRLLRSSSERFAVNANTWVTIQREDKRDLALYAVPIGGAGDALARTILILVDLSTAPQPRAAVLEKLFGLTGAEARLAIQIGRGETPADIALEHGVSMPTVRSQLASVFAKTQTSRQAELVALLARIAILP